MVLVFDFSAVKERLNRSVAALSEAGDQVFSTTALLVRPFDSTLGECLQEMLQRDLRTCIVHFPNGDACSEVSPSPGKLIDVRRFYRILDMRDVVRYILHPEQADAAGVPGSQKQLGPLLGIPVGKVANLSRANDFVPALSTDTLLSILHKFDQSSRIIVFQQESPRGGEVAFKIFTLFSVIDFLRFLESLSSSSVISDFFLNLNTPRGRESPSVKGQALMPVDAWTAEAIKKATARPRKPSAQSTSDGLTFCYEDDSLYSALKLLDAAGFSALPVVEAGNPKKCLSVFSLRDLLPILLQKPPLPIMYGKDDHVSAPAHVNALVPPASSALLSHTSILEYIASLRQIQCLKARFPVIQVRQNALINTVIAKILASNVRRLILVDENVELTGILSVTDLGRFLARHIAQGDTSAL